MEREHKLSSYTLSALALHFLKESRMELSSSDLERLSTEEPRVLGDLVQRDAGLALRLFSNQHCLFRYVEMARVTGVPMEFLLTRGQSVKVLSMLLRKARAFGYVLPPSSRPSSGLEEGSNTYEGGAVLEPETGYYDEPVVTLDFASLYPSIMQKHNLCYSTLLHGPAPEGKEGEQSHEVVPGLGHRFVTSKVRRGLVPMVLEELLTARAKAKKELKALGQGSRNQTCNARISANSVYGFTGMSVGALPCQAIAASVTASRCFHGRSRPDTDGPKGNATPKSHQATPGHSKPYGAMPDELDGFPMPSNKERQASDRCAPHLEDADHVTSPPQAAGSGLTADLEGQRSCAHFFHLRCLERVEGPHCPQCRGRFFRRAPLPRPTEHGWRQLVAPTGLRRELAAGPDGLVWSFFMEKMSGLRACVELPPDEVEALLSNYADDDFLSGEQMYEILKSVQDYVPDLADPEPKVCKEEPKGGCRCPCGRMHVRRGDRVKRGKGQAEDGRRMARRGVCGVCGEATWPKEESDARGRVLVKWDRLPKVHQYSWPGPESDVLQSAPFWELAADVQKLQELTVP
eukprot:g24089.t1